MKRVRQIMEDLAAAKPTEWVSNFEIRLRVVSDSEITRIVGKPIDSTDAMIIVNWVSRGYDRIERFLEAHARGITTVRGMLSAGVPAYPFSEDGLDALTAIHRRFLRSTQRPFAYRLRDVPIT